MNIGFSSHFRIHLATFDDKTRQAVLDCISHVKKHGLKDLQGRNKSSTLPNPHTKRQRANFAYAQKHCLWHYHIGIPCYVGKYGDCTSEYVLHYQRFDDEITLVDLTAHPPFELPLADDLR